jgi:hypothetical protein
MIAISNKELENQSPCFSDVVYIGMTNAKGGLSSRLKQFKFGLLKGKGHSGANTIHKEYFDKGVKYVEGTSQIGKETVYVCTSPVKCDTKEPTENVLRIMGQVAYLEYEVMAQYYEAMSKKPKYNKKWVTQSI